MRLFRFKDKICLDRWLRVYIHHKNLFTKGRGEIDFVRGLTSYQGIILAWLFVKSLWPAIPYWVVVIGAPAYFVLEVTICWSLGRWWDKNKIFQKEADWGNKRDPVARAINEELLKKDSIKGL